MYEYYFLIIDNEISSETAYKFTARFNNHFEASQLIEENETAGNKIIVLKPFYKFIPDAKSFN